MAVSMRVGPAGGDGRGRRRGAAALLLALAMVPLAACGGDDDDETTADGGATGTTVAEVAVFLLADGDACDEVVAVTRRVEGEPDVEAAMTALVAGPTADEEADGLGGWFSTDTEGMVLATTTEGATVRVDLDPALPEVIPNASSSCGSMGLLAQLDATALQASGATGAVYSLGGDVEAFYAWLQLGPPE